MADELQNQQGGQSLTSRARRIKDEEWESRRPEIEKLYREKRCSRKEVIEKLNQDGFPVTEKQLKHILQKWGAKKKVASSDMQNMLSVKRQREEDGKTTDFVYHGHPVDGAKLGRAEKRLKNPIVPNTKLPSYIEALSPKLPSQSPFQSRAIARTSLVEDPISDPGSPPSSCGTSFGNLYSLMTDQWPTVSRSKTPELGTYPHEMGEKNQSWPVNIMQLDHTENEASLNPHESLTSITNNEYDLSFPTEPAAHNIDPLIEIVSTSVMSNCGTSGQKLCSRLPTPVPNWAIASPHIAAVNINPTDRIAVHQTPSRQELEPLPFSNKISFNGTSPESILQSVQMMRDFFYRLQDDIFWNQNIPPWIASDLKLRQLIKEEDFLSEIDEIALWSYQASVNMVRQQRAARQSAGTDIQSFSRRCIIYNERMCWAYTWQLKRVSEDDG